MCLTSSEVHWFSLGSCLWCLPMYSNSIALKASPRFIFDNSPTHSRSPSPSPSLSIFSLQNSKPLLSLDGADGSREAEKDKPELKALGCRGFFNFFLLWSRKRTNLERSLSKIYESTDNSLFYIVQKQRIARPLIGPIGPILCLL